MNSRRSFLGSAMGLGAAAVSPISLPKLKEKIKLDKDNKDHYWTMRGGKDIFIGNMEDGHLFNTISMLVDKSKSVAEVTGDNWQDHIHPQLDIMRSELEHRKQNNVPKV